MKNITIENADVRFRNFSGKAGQYNPEGRRNFCVFLDDEDAENFKELGLNVKYLNPRDPGDDPQAYLQIAVEYKNYPPKVFLVTHKGKTMIGEDEIGMLDWAEIQHVDLMINPYVWENSRGHGIKAYLKSMYVTLYEDELDLKYTDVPDSAMSAIKNG